MIDTSNMKEAPKGSTESGFSAATAFIDAVLEAERGTVAANATEVLRQMSLMSSVGQILFQAMLARAPKDWPAQRAGVVGLSSGIAITAYQLAGGSLVAALADALADGLVDGQQRAAEVLAGPKCEGQA